MKRLKKPWLMLILVAGLVSAMTIATVAGCGGEDNGGGGGGSKTFTVSIASGISNGTVKIGKSATTLGTDPVTGVKLSEWIYVSATPDAGDYQLKPGSLIYRNTGTSGAGTTISTSRFRLTSNPRNVEVTATFEVNAPDPRPPAKLTLDEWNAILDIWEGEFKPLVDSMTPTQMAAQMTQGEYDHVTTQEVVTDELGSILSGGHSGPASNGSSSQGTPQQWAAYINEKVNASLTTALKIPVIYGYDAMHGNSKVKNATLLPHNIGLGAIYVGDPTRGRMAGYEAGLLTAKEMIAGNVRWTFGPVVSVPFDIRWGRTYECYSENYAVVEDMGRGVTRGLHDGGVGTTPKHYIAEGQTTDGKSKANAPDIDFDGELLKQLLQPYIAAIEERCMAIMVTYSQINGKQVTETKELLQDLLKEKHGYRGMFLSDWSTVTELSGASYQAQLVNAINAGLDMVMAAGSKSEWGTTISNIVAANTAGEITTARLRDATMRILLFKRSIGWMADQQTQDDPGWWNVAGNTVKSNNGSPMRTTEDMKTAAAMVSDSLVLLKNDDALLSKMDTFDNILITGAGGDDIGLACGGWSISWQGAAGATTAGVTIQDGIKTKLGGTGKTVTYTANATSGTYDLVIAVVAEAPYAEGSGDRSGNNTVIWRADDNNVLTNAKARAGETGKVILLILSGRPQHLQTYADIPDAIIAAWWPGSEAGTGIADVLFGDRDFVGKTPMTWKRAQNAAEALYPFGHGLKKAEPTR